MAKAKYATRQHRDMVAIYRKQVDAGDGWCAEAVCLMSSRFIAPGSPVDAAHDPTGTSYIGPAHPRCNRSEGARRRNGKHLPLTTRRWAL